MKEKLASRLSTVWTGRPSSSQVADQKAALLQLERSREFQTEYLDLGVKLALLEISEGTDVGIRAGAKRLADIG